MPTRRSSAALAPIRRHWRWLSGALVLIVLSALVGGAVIFKPWLLWVNTEIHDEIPAAVTAGPSGPLVAAPILVSQGHFISHEHTTSGDVAIITKPHGATIVAIRGLSTTTGPDVHVWLSAAPVIAGVSGWRSADDAPHVDVGELKGNRGDQVYTIPAGIDLAQFQAVVLWCEQFSVSFGAAQLSTV